jgi:hypothetical protein
VVAVLIFGWVNWGEVVMTPGNPRIGTPDKYYLEDRGWASTSIIFSVYA